MGRTLALYKRLHKRTLDASTWFFRHTRMVTRTVEAGRLAAPAMAGANHGPGRPRATTSASAAGPGRIPEPLPTGVDGG
jgi:hypothetical protein